VAVHVCCSECGDTFMLSSRNEYEHRRSGKPHRCRTCRLPDTDISRERVEDAKRWWLRHYTLDELRSRPAVPASLAISTCLGPLDNFALAAIAEPGAALAGDPETAEIAAATG
jgi:hypothetical protein